MLLPPAPFPPTPTTLRPALCWHQLAAACAGAHAFAAVWCASAAGAVPRAPLPLLISLLCPSCPCPSCPSCPCPCLSVSANTACLPACLPPSSASSVRPSVLARHTGAGLAAAGGVGALAVARSRRQWARERIRIGVAIDTDQAAFATITTLMVVGERERGQCAVEMVATENAAHARGWIRNGEGRGRGMRRRRRRRGGRQTGK